MKRIFAFATGNLWRWAPHNDTDRLIDKIKKLAINGLELTFAKKEELYNFKLTAKNLRWLKKLDYISIHAPFKLITKAENEKEVIKQLNYLKKVYHLTGAKNIIIHPRQLPPPRLLNKYKMRFSVENTPKRNMIDIKKLGLILKKYKKIGLCLDVAHAYFYSQYETGEIINKFRKKITQVHFSGTYKNMEHQSLPVVTLTFLKSVKPVRALSVPIIMEEDIDQNKNITWVKNEIKYIKSWLWNI
jgi:sugar phosphate isomerase/epimerase